MTDDEAVVNDAEAIISEAIEQGHLNQTKEHQAMMPYLAVYARDAIAQKGSDPNGIHLFVIQQGSDVDIKEAHNPLKMSLDDSTVGEMVPWFTFPDIHNATQNMASPTSAILWNEVRKQRSSSGNGIAVYVRVSETVQALYCAGKLTITKIVANGDPMTKTARIAETDPYEFFDTLSMSVDEKALCGSLIAMAEMGRMMESEMPDTYQLMLKRTIDGLESDE